jgi:hypothetical protein
MESPQSVQQTIVARRARSVGIVRARLFRWQFAHGAFLALIFTRLHSTCAAYQEIVAGAASLNARLSANFQSDLVFAQELQPAIQMTGRNPGSNRSRAASLMPMVRLRAVRVVNVLPGSPDRPPQ